MAGVTVLLFGFIGIILAAIEYTLYTEGILIDEFVTGSVTITDVMAFTVIAVLIFGVFIAVARR